MLRRTSSGSTAARKGGRRRHDQAAHWNHESASAKPAGQLGGDESDECYDFYYEVEITRNAASYFKTRRYRIDVTYNDGAAQSVSTVTPREIYVEKLVSQNRNEVQDVLLNGVSIPLGGTLNLVLGNTYTITLEASTATNGYEQIESFINFKNTIFQILSVTTTYTAFPVPDTDPLAYEKMYADGCGWVNDPTDVTTPKYASAQVRASTAAR